MDAILQMPGPEFLTLYLTVVGSGLTASYLVMRWSDSGGLETPVPADPDPYELAYLKAGEKGVSELALLELIQSGRLAADEGAQRPKLKPVPGTFRDTLAAPLERIVTLFHGGREVRNVVRSKEYRREIEMLASPFRQRIDGSGLIASESRKSKVKLIALVTLGLGVLKLATALTAGRFNVVFLIVLLSIAAIGFFVIARFRLTWTGLRYMKKLRAAYGDQSLESYNAEHADPAERRALLTVAALYGAACLMQTPGAAYAEMIGANRPNYSTGGGCGSSCGGDSGGGDGGCGGGCGGCGGD